MKKNSQFVVVTKKYFRVRNRYPRLKMLNYLYFIDTSAALTVFQRVNGEFGLYPRFVVDMLLIYLS